MPDFGGDDIRDALDDDPIEIGDDENSDDEPAAPTEVDTVADFDSDARAPGQAREGVEANVSVDAADEAVRETRLKSLTEARRAVAEYRRTMTEKYADLKRRAGEEEANELMVAGLNRRVVTYAEEVEPLLARSRVGRELYLEMNYGTVTISAPETTTRGRGKQERVVDPRRTAEVEIVGVKGYLDAGAMIEREFEREKERKGRGRGTKTTTETVSKPVPTKISAKVYRSLNAFLEEIGLDIDVSHSGDGGASWSVEDYRG